jgi:NifU-like protein involved in Fe-S cluster formation
MDEVVTRIYRSLLQEGFSHTGSIENPAIFLDTKLEGISLCSQAGRDYMNIYVDIQNGVITEIKYLCFCDPTSNVVVETLCQLAKGKTVEQAKALSQEDFFKVIGSKSELVQKKVVGILELLNRGISRFECGVV